MQCSTLQKPGQTGEKADRVEQPKPGHRQQEHRSAAGGYCCHNIVTVVREECGWECCLSGMVACPQEHGWAAIQARAVLYQLVIRRRAPWDLLLIQQGCPGTGPHPTIRRCSVFTLINSLLWYQLVLSSPDEPCSQSWHNWVAPLTYKNTGRVEVNI